MGSLLSPVLLSWQRLGTADLQLTIKHESIVRWTHQLRPPASRYAAIMTFSVKSHLWHNSPHDPWGSIQIAQPNNFPSELPGEQWHCSIQWASWCRRKRAFSRIISCQFQKGKRSQFIHFLDTFKIFSLKDVRTQKGKLSGLNICLWNNQCHFWQESLGLDCLHWRNLEMCSALKCPIFFQCWCTFFCSRLLNYESTMALDTDKWPIFSLLDPEFIQSIRTACVFGSSGNEAIIITNEDDVYALGSNCSGCLGLGTWHCFWLTETRILCKFRCQKCLSQVELGHCPWLIRGYSIPEIAQTLKFWSLIGDEKYRHFKHTKTGRCIAVCGPCCF